MNENIIRISQAEIARVIKMPVKILFRNSIKLLRFYPSKNRDEIRKDIILDYRDGAKLTNPEEIDKAIELGRKSLVHIMSYHLIRNELLYGDGLLHIDATTPKPASPKQVKKLEEILNNTKQKDAKYEFF